ncbi:hypothetical protein AKO1_012992 [Acrasis kona]|uniref:PI3K/PI4K catalytic domain-containing protein n=1 Tax=Acrasis kona TaxID=1008807 RepID=A0AAW2YZ32_9EUKA
MRSYINAEERVAQELDTIISLIRKQRGALHAIFTDQNQRPLLLFVKKHRTILYKEKKLYTTCCMTVNERDCSGDINVIISNPHPDLTTEDALELIFRLHQHARMRRLAVSILEKRPSCEVEIFIPQLLQSIYLFNDTSDSTGIYSFLTKIVVSSPAIYNKMLWLLRLQQTVKPNPVLGTLYIHLEQYSVEMNEQCRVLFNKQEKLIYNLNNIGRYLSTNLNQLSRHDRVKQLKCIIEGTHDFPQYVPMMNLEKGVVKTVQNIQDRVCRMYDWDVIFPLDCLPMESFPNVIVTKILVENCNVFKSAMAPLLIPFQTNDNQILSMIFKRGDDLRQDMLMLQVMRFMDLVLRQNHLDLHLTLYDVMAMGVDHGMVELVPNSHTISSVLSAHGTIYKFLHTKNKSFRSFDCSLKTFVKSCAGYCIITFLLGIGDRHLDNIMLCEDGRMFHIEFWFCTWQRSKAAIHNLLSSDNQPNGRKHEVARKSRIRSTCRI